MLLAGPRALAGGRAATYPSGVLTPKLTFWLKTHLFFARFFPLAEARGLVKSRCVSVV